MRRKWKGNKAEKYGAHEKSNNNTNTRNRLFMCMIASDFVTFSVKCHHLNIKAVHIQYLVGDRRDRKGEQEIKRRKGPAGG